MSDALKIAVQITAIDMLSGVVKRARDSVLSLGGASTQVKKDFDDMNRHITAGLKSLAVSAYALNKVKPGVAVAGDLQEAMIDVKLNLLESGKSAKALDDELAKVRSTAIDVSKVAPFSAQEVVGIENTFLKAGLSLKDVTAQGGAAWAATALATISKEAPAAIADAMVTMATPFNVKGGQFGELADWIQKVDAASVTTIPELMEGMKYVSGTAAVMKVSWQDTIRALGVVAQSGLRGSMGGTALNDFLIRLNGTSRETRRIMKELNEYLAGKGGSKVEFFDKAGKLKGLPVIINDLRQAMSKLTDKQKMFVMEKIFGEQGARAALALIKEGEGSWEKIGEQIKNAASIQEKMNERLKGFNANLKALGGTSKTTIATLFDPLLEPLSKAAAYLNDIVANIGKLAEERPGVAKAVSYGTAGVAAGAGLYGVYRLLRGGISGGMVLKGLKGLGGTAAGIAEGKIVQAATGVTPVFVTNWPAGGIGAPSIPGSGGGGVVGKMGKIAAGARALVFNPLTAFLGGAGILAYNMVTDKPEERLGKIEHYEWDTRSEEALRKAMANIKPEVRNQINLNIKIDKDGRIVTDSDDLLTQMIVNTDRGDFAAPYRR
jgi:TP901 family phage tail tape measure protein